MVTKIAWPDVVITLKRATFEIMNAYFSGGVVHEINDTPVTLDTARLTFNLEDICNANNVNESSKFPQIAFLGGTTNLVNESRCQKDDGTIISVRKITVSQAVYVSVPRNYTGKRPGTDSMEKGSMLIVDRVWSHMLFALNDSASMQKERGIQAISLPEIPQDISDEHYFVNTQRIQFTVTTSRPRL